MPVEPPTFARVTAVAVVDSAALPTACIDVSAALHVCVCLRLIGVLRVLCCGGGAVTVTRLPEYAAKVGILMKSFLTEADVAAITKVLVKANWRSSSGANKMAKLGVAMHLGVLQSNDTTVAAMFANIWSILVIQPGECRLLPRPTSVTASSPHFLHCLIESLAELLSLYRALTLSLSLARSLSLALALSLRLHLLVISCLFATTDTSGDGIQPDGCFYQHGAMLQSGSYGVEYVNDVMGYIPVSHGTSFAITQQGTDILTMLLLDGMQVCSC